MKYTVTVDVERHVFERLKMVIDADGYDEAEDIAYEVAFDPDTPLAVDRLLCVARDTLGSPEVKVVECVSEVEEVYDDGA